MVAFFLSWMTNRKSHVANGREASWIQIGNTPRKPKTGPVLDPTPRTYAPGLFSKMRRFFSAKEREFLP